MSDKINDTLDKNAESVGKVTPTVFDYADFNMRCSCGHVHVIDTQIQGMLQFNMYTTDMHNMLLVCPSCGHEMELFFTEAEAPEQVENPLEDVEPQQEVEKEVENEPVQEESKN